MRAGKQREGKQAFVGFMTQDCNDQESDQYNQWKDPVVEQIQVIMSPTLDWSTLGIEQ